jgi:choline-sulfatase
MADEHRFDLSGFAGNDIVRTPTLDRLADGSTIFDNAYTASPICIPGRQSLMAGQLPSTSGCRVYGEDLPAGHLTFARQFARHGYATVACGKLHHMGPDQMQGWTQRVGGDTAIGPRFTDVLPGISIAQPPAGTGKWSQPGEIRRAGAGYGQHTAADDYTVTGAINVIHEYFASPAYDRPLDHQPLLLKVSLLQPHYPYLADPDLFSYYLNRVSPYLDQQLSAHPALSKMRVTAGVDVTERELRRATAAYYAMVETVDRQFARVLAALDHVGQDIDDWIVVYTSDHGEMLGQHGIWEKQKLYEASARVPLLVRSPITIAAPRRCAANVSTCDLYATLCELAGLPVPDGLDSRSLVRFLGADHGTGEQWNNEVISQFGHEHLMVKQDSLKYQYYGANLPEVLFDLALDPSENTDLINDPGYESALGAFRRRRAELGYGAGPKVSRLTR